MNTINNAVNLIGNLGNAPERYESEKGMAVVRFRLATDEFYLKDGEKASKTQWHSCVCFGKQAESLYKYAKKGRKMVVKGQIDYSTYIDKDGVKRNSTQIKVSSFSFLDKKEEA